MKISLQWMERLYVSTAISHFHRTFCYHAIIYVGVGGLIDRRFESSQSLRFMWRRGHAQQERKSRRTHDGWFYLRIRCPSLPLEIAGSGGHATTIDPTSGMQTSISYFRTPASAADRVISEWVWMWWLLPLLSLGSCLFVPRIVLTFHIFLSKAYYSDYFFFSHDSFLYIR